MAVTAAAAACVGLAAGRRAGKVPRHFFATETKEVVEEVAATATTQHPAGSRVPEGTPEPHPMAIRKRPRRNRRSAAQRDMFAETRPPGERFRMAE